MNLWIRSQDKKILTPINKMITTSCNGIFYDGLILGMYKNEKRALEVLDKIEKILLFEIKSNNYKEMDLILKAYMLPKIYEMPEE